MPDSLVLAGQPGLNQRSATELGQRHARPPLRGSRRVLVTELLDELADAFQGFLQLGIHGVCLPWLWISAYPRRLGGSRQRFADTRTVTQAAGARLRRHQVTPTIGDTFRGGVVTRMGQMGSATCPNWVAQSGSGSGSRLRENNESAGR